MRHIIEKNKYPLATLAVAVLAGFMAAYLCHKLVISPISSELTGEERVAAENWRMLVITGSGLAAFAAAYAAVQRMRRWTLAPLSR